MSSFRFALCVAALFATSGLAWADNIVVNNSTFSALPPSPASDANCPSLVFFNGVCANPVSAPTQQQQAVAQQTTLTQFSALPLGGSMAVVAPSPASGTYCPSLVFFNGVCANPVSAPTQQQQANPVAQQTMFTQFSAVPSGGSTAVVDPGPASGTYCPSLVFFNGVCAFPVSAPTQQQLQSDVGAPIYLGLIGGAVGQGDFSNMLLADADPAPEPSTLALLFAGAAATWFAMRYRRSLAVSRT